LRDKVFRGVILSNSPYTEIDAYQVTTTTSSFQFPIVDDGTNTTGPYHITNCTVNAFPGNPLGANPNGQAITIFSSVGSKLENNTILGGFFGLIYTGNNGSINDNNCSYTSDSAFYINSDSSSLSNNNISNSNGVGIECDSCNNTIVNENYVNVANIGYTDDGTSTNTLFNSNIALACQVPFQLTSPTSVNLNPIIVPGNLNASNVSSTGISIPRRHRLERIWLRHLIY
jgi:hypothetical protein